MWTKPEHDGGAKIDSYVVEMLKSGTVDWIRVVDNVSLLECFLKGLMEKQEYSFRVRAVNVAGESEPSEPSDPVLCKERLSKFMKCTCVDTQKPKEADIKECVFPQTRPQLPAGWTWLPSAEAVPISSGRSQNVMEAPPLPTMLWRSATSGVKAGRLLTPP